MPHHFPVRLRDLRSDRGITRRKLANAVGVSMPTLWGWESGRTRPRANNLEALARVLNVSPGYLAGGQSAHPSHASYELEDYVSDARLNIAKLAGVKIEKVRISIDF